VNGDRRYDAGPMIPRRPTLGKAAILCAAVSIAPGAGAPREARAGEIPAPEPPAEARPAAERRPLVENFCPTEIAVTVAAAASGIFFNTAGPRLFGGKPGMGPPDPDSFDARLARSLYGADGTNRRFLAGIPDGVGATLLPILPLVHYGANTVALLARGEPAWTAGEANPHHKLLGYVEAVGWTYLVTGLAKTFVGRPRPYTEAAANHPELRKKPSEDNLSFFSLHASGSFAVGAFAAEDASRYLRTHVLAGAPAWRRALLGSVVPYTLGYGLPAVIALSRVIDQQHWPSDVALGAVTGVLVSHLVYSVHFDAGGRPRRRHGEGATAGRALVLPIAARDAAGEGMVGMGVAARF
jgi:membrane-associated phospholipid phosphatase